MKVTCLIVFLFVPVVSYGQKDSTTKPINYPLQIILENLDSISAHVRKNYPRFRNLRIKIRNTADTAFSFYIMSCDLDGCTRLKPQIGNRSSSGCDRNVCEKITLKPNEFHVLQSEYFFDKPKLNHSIKVSAGFRVITKMPKAEDITENTDEFTPNRLSIFSDDLKYTDKDFIWSNNISIIF